MSKVSDYKIEKFTSLKDTPDTYDPGKYVKVEADGLNYADVDATLSGINDSGGGLNYKYKFDTAVSGTLVSGTFQFNNTNYRAASQINISYFDSAGTDLTTWIDSWDDSDKAVKGTATFKAVRDDTKYVTYKLKETGGSMFGDGRDGNVTITGSVNMSTDVVAAGRSYPDMVSYSVSAVGLSSCQTTEVPNGIEVGDVVLLINVQGCGDYALSYNVGNYESFIVDSIVNTTISFKSNKTKLYGDTDTDNNIGTGSTNQKVVLIRVPQYSEFTVQSGAELVIDSWNGLKNGIFCIMCSNTATIVGDINTTGAGYRFHSYSVGESYRRTHNFASSSPNDGGGASRDSQGHAGIAGGSYGTRGKAGRNWITPGYTYGTEDLHMLYYGSSAGGTDGGDGGGMIYIIAKEFSLYGSIKCDGTIRKSSTDYGGSGSGGSILIKTNKISMNSGSISATGGPPGRVWEEGATGEGGDGRIAIYYNILMDSFSNVSPSPYTSDLVIAGSSTRYNAEWLNGNNTFNDEEEVFVSYSYNY